MKKVAVLSLVSLIMCILASSFSVSYALSEEGASNATFNFEVAPIGIKKTITYHLPKVGSTSEFEKTSIQVDVGTSLYSALEEYTSDINLFSFASWNSSKDHFRSGVGNDDIASTYIVSDDIEVYGKYVRENTLYYYHDVDKVDMYMHNTYFLDYTLNASSVYVGTQYYSISGVEGNEVDLSTASGVYTFTNNGSDWTIKRKVIFNIKNVTWWSDGTEHSRIYCFNSNDESMWIEHISFIDNVYTAYIDAKYDKFVLVRSPSTNSGWDGFWNKTVDIDLNNKYWGSSTYSKSSTTVYISDGKSDGNNGYTWGK